MIHSGVIEIVAFSFCKCSSLTNILIPNTVTEIWSYTFADSSSLNQIETLILLGKLDLMLLKAVIL